MASTGLLTGVNPYKGGNVAIDFSSKPTQYAIQELQHQQAKAEATEKYYKDWEKSLNTAGIGEQERKIFAEKLNALKGYAIKNREQVYNPSKYGYDAQSTVEAGFKDLQSFLEGSKQKTAENKAYKTVVDQHRAQGKLVEGDMEVWKDASLPYGAGYVAPDLSRIKISDPHDEDVFREKTWKGIDLPGDIITEKQTKEIIGANGKVLKKETGLQRDVKVESITEPVAKSYDIRAKGFYRGNRGTQIQYDKLFQDKDYVEQFNPIYEKYLNKKIESPEELLSATGLASKQPKSEVATAWKDPNKAKQDQIDLMYLRKHLDDMQVKGDYADALTGLDKGSIGRVTIYDAETKQNQIWNRLPIDESIRKDFTIPTRVAKTNTRGEVIGYTMKSLPAQEILVDKKGNIIAHSDTIDEDGNVISKSFEKIQISPESLAGKLLKTEVGVNNRSLAIKSAVENWKKRTSNYGKSYTFKGKSYTHNDLLDQGYSDSDIEKAINLGTIKVK
jgi:hypothetical protein